MHPAVKVLIGLLIMVGSVWWVLEGSAKYLGRSGLEDLISVINGAVPPLLFLLGVFIVWLEYDEWKIERELREEEEREKRRRRKKKRR